LAVGVDALGMRLQQPLIAVFIMVGILVGPSLLGWESANDRIHHGQYSRDYSESDRLLRACS